MKPMPAFSLLSYEISYMLNYIYNVTCVLHDILLKETSVGFGTK